MLMSIKLRSNRKWQNLHLRTSDKKEQEEELKDMYNDIRLKRGVFKTFIETEDREHYAVQFHVSIIYVWKLVSGTE